MRGIYAFGSLVRGEIDRLSDIDLLAITVDHEDSRFSRETFSVYLDSRIQELWIEGNPFAWHLYHQAQPVYLPNNVNYLKSLGEPSPYKNAVRDIERFSEIYSEALDSLYAKSHPSPTFELSTVFLAIRNAATAFSLRPGGAPTFSRNAARCLGENSVCISDCAFEVLQRARVLSTRGYGTSLARSEADAIKAEMEAVGPWMSKLIKLARMETNE